MTPADPAGFYDAQEAARYDGTRGGAPRARAAAEAVASLLPPTARTVVDVGTGTGLVAAALAGVTGAAVVGVDASRAMLAHAGVRLPGRVAAGRAGALPIRSGGVDAVALVWVLHLLPDPEAVLAEAVRVLGPDGVLVTTVDKAAARRAAADDVDAVLDPARGPVVAATDGSERVAATLDRLGFGPAGDATFVGHGQGLSPRAAGAWLAALPGDVDHARRDAARAALDALPDPDRPRPDPVYAVRAFRRR